MFINSRRASAAVVVLVACGVGACVATTASGEPVLRGIATVVDGDGLDLAGRKIRLFGIDAFEVDQYCRRPDKSRWRCGQYSTVALDEFAGGREVDCRVKTEDRYGRAVAVCRYAGKDLAAEQVRSGWALAYRKYSKDYVHLEDEARKRERGAWAGTFDQPSAWRSRGRSK